MPDNATVAAAIKAAEKRNERLVGILTSFFQEASVLVFVFGILDTYAANRLSRGVAVVVGILGFAFLIAAVAVKRVFDRLATRRIRHVMALVEQSGAGSEQ